MKKLLNKILIPFAIVHVRIIQYRYKKITLSNINNQTSSNITVLELLQAKEYYYERQFESWGKFHPKFSYNNRQLRRHNKFMNWLFPEKNFKELDIVVWHNPRAVTYYHNKIFALQGNISSMYEVEIKSQLKQWRTYE